MFLEDHTVGLEAGGVDIRDVVGDDVEFALKRDLPRQSDERTVLHRSKLPNCDAAKPSQAHPVLLRRSPLPRRAFAG